MQLQDNLLTVFTATIDDQESTPVLQLPERELELGTLATDDTYQVAILSTPDTGEESSDSTTRPSNRSASSAPPVSKGEEVEVEIEDDGEQGDGIARVGPGYVIFVPDTELGDRVTIRVTKVRDNFGFGEVVTPEPVSG